MDKLCAWFCFGCARATFKLLSFLDFCHAAGTDSCPENPGVGTGGVPADAGAGSDRDRPGGRGAGSGAVVASGSKEANKIKVGKITKEKLMEVVKRKMPDLNAHTVEQAMKIIAGSARSMGVEVK